MLCLQRFYFRLLAFALFLTPILMLNVGCPTEPNASDDAGSPVVDGGDNDGDGDAGSLVVDGGDNDGDDDAGSPIVDGGDNDGDGDGGSTDSCSEISDDYAALVSNQMCDDHDDCQIVQGQCSVGLGGCYHAVNQSVTQDDLNALGASWFQASCGGGVCDCAPPPTFAICLNDVCTGSDTLPPADAGTIEPDAGQPADDGGQGHNLDSGTPTQNDAGQPVQDGGQPAPDGGSPSSDAGSEVQADGGEALSCNEIETHYDSLVGFPHACDTDQDCQILEGQCGVGLGACYHAVNDSVSQQDLVDLAQTYSQTGCTGPVCDCPPPPPDAICNETGFCIGADLCQETEDTYESLVSMTQCDGPLDCHILDGHCGQGLGGCFYAVNISVTADQLNAVAQDWQANDCMGPVCACAAPPTDVDCIDEQCVGIN